MSERVNLSKHTVNLGKSEKINLTKAAEIGLNKIMIGLGWDPIKKSKGFISKLFGKSSDEADIDCDAWVQTYNKGSKKDGELIYYGNLKYIVDDVNAIVHQGDNLTGEGDGDDEVINVFLDELPDNVDKLVVGVTIFQAVQRKQSFGMIKNVFIRIVDTRDNFEICRYDGKDFSSDSHSFIAGILEKTSNGWEFTAVGKSTPDGTIHDAAETVSRELV